MGLYSGIEDGEYDLRRDEHVLGSGWNGYAGARSYRRDQYHAGFSERTHPRNRIAQSPGRHESEHSVSFLSRRIVAYARQRTNWDFVRRSVDDGDGNGAWPRRF